MAPTSSKPKNKNISSVQVDYLVHIQEIKPWPPSQSLRSLHFIVLQWEYGDFSSGSTNPVVPSLGSGVRDGKIEFNEYFRVPIRALSKNFLEFSLHEPHRDNVVRGQLLGTAVIDLAEYGVLKETVTMSIPVNCNRIFSNTSQPVLFLKVQPLGKNRSNSSARENPLRETSLVIKDKEQNKLEKLKERTGGINMVLELPYSSSFDSSYSLIQSRERGRNASLASYGKGSLTSNSNESEISNEEGKDKDASSNINMRNFNRVDFNGTKTTKENARQSHVREYGTDGIASKITSSVTDHMGKSREKGENDKKAQGHRKKEQEKAGSDITVDKATEEQEEIDREAKKKKENNHYTNGRSMSIVSSDVIKKPVSSPSDIPFMKDIKEIKDAGPTRNTRKPEKKDAVTLHGVAKNNSFDSRVEQLDHKIEKLEEELREVAAIEIALYSVVAEHISSPKKFLAPARRLSRFYLHAYKDGSLSRKENAARPVVSGLVVVAKACGKDVPRLTFWLSNSVALRVIVSQAIENSQPPVSNASKAKISSLSNWTKFSPGNRERKFGFTDKLEELENPANFVTALEKIEAWISSRIVESAWQILIPYMQSASQKENKQDINSSSKKVSERNHRIMSHRGQASFSLELWKKALKDVYARLCPVQAGGHNCACFSLMNRLIMEQCVDRLDAAMFNAFLRESSDEASTNPVSNPIGDAKVLPVPVGKSSFSIGVQLKNVILNWSKWLNSLLGINDEEGEQNKSTLRSFRRLNALSDLMMLPKDMLMDRSYRKEVCPAFGAPLIKRILKNFVPDEFSPEPIPKGLFDALDSPVSPDNSSEKFTGKFACNAMPIVYSPPSAASLAGIIDVKSESQAKKSSPLDRLQQPYVSDDELEDLSSPLTSIFNEKSYGLAPPRKLKESGSNNLVRYQLLQEAWR